MAQNGHFWHFWSKSPTKCKLIDQLVLGLGFWPKLAKMTIFDQFYPGPINYPRAIGPPRPKRGSSPCFSVLPEFLTPKFSEFAENSLKVWGKFSLWASPTSMLLLSLVCWNAENPLQFFEIFSMSKALLGPFLVPLIRDSSPRASDP